MALDFDSFGPYTVYECLGTGGMATVHRAMRDDGVTVQEVALKRLLPQHADDKTFVEDFVREGKLAARLSHPSIVKVVDLGKIDRTHFIAMELVLGKPLMHLIRTAHFAKTMTPIGVVIAVMSELCDALDYACNGTDPETGERFNVVHRDLSPSNLIITEDGHVKVIDFGVAKTTVGKFTTSTGLVKGKLGYMAVEALTGKQLDGRSDVFSVGVVAWELITGRRLFVGKNEFEVIQRVRDGVVAPPSTYNPSCPPTLDSIVERALARNKEDRWASAGAMRQALDMLRRAYTEEATAESVVTWCAAIAPADPKREPDLDSEQTRAMPVQARRHATVLDLLDEPAMAEGSTPDAEPLDLASVAQAPMFREDDAYEGTAEALALSFESEVRSAPSRDFETAEMTAQGPPPTSVSTTMAAMTIETPVFSQDDLLDLEEPLAPPPGPTTSTTEVPLLDLEALDAPSSLDLTKELKQPDTVITKRGG